MHAANEEPDMSSLCHASFPIILTFTLVRNFCFEQLISAQQYLTDGLPGLELPL